MIRIKHHECGAFLGNYGHKRAYLFWAQFCDFWTYSGGVGIHSTLSRAIIVLWTMFLHCGVLTHYIESLASRRFNYNARSQSQCIRQIEPEEYSDCEVYEFLSVDREFEKPEDCALSCMYGDSFSEIPFETPQSADPAQYLHATQQDERTYLSARIVLRNYKIHRHMNTDKVWVREECRQLLECIVHFERRFANDVAEEIAANNPLFLHTKDRIQRETHYLEYQGMVIEEEELRKHVGEQHNAHADYMVLARKIIAYEQYENTYNRSILKRECERYKENADAMSVTDTERERIRAAFNAERINANARLARFEADTAAKECAYQCSLQKWQTVKSG